MQEPLVKAQDGVKREFSGRGQSSGTLSTREGVRAQELGGQRKQELGGQFGGNIQMIKKPYFVKAFITSYKALGIPNWDQLIANVGWNHHLYDPIRSAIIAQSNGPISFGFRDNLLEFSIGTKSVSFPDWPQVFGSSGNLLDLSVFNQAFREVTETCVSGGYKIHFNLDNIIDNPSNLSAINNGLVPLDDTNLTTLWELGMVMRNVDLYSNTVFYQNGKVIKLDRLLDVGIVFFN